MIGLIVRVFVLFSTNVYVESHDTELIYYASLDLFIQDWLDNKYGDANLTTTQKNYYESLQNQAKIGDEITQELFYHPKNNTFMPMRGNQIGINEIYRFSKLVEASIEIRNRHKRNADKQPNEDVREETKKMKQKIKNKGQKGWRDYMKQKKENRRDRGVVHGPKPYRTIFPLPITAVPIHPPKGNKKKQNGNSPSNKPSKNKTPNTGKTSSKNKTPPPPPSKENGSIGPSSKNKHNHKPTKKQPKNNPKQQTPTDPPQNKKNSRPKTPKIKTPPTKEKVAASPPASDSGKGKDPPENIVMPPLISPPPPPRITVTPYENIPLPKGDEDDFIDRLVGRKKRDLGDNKATIGQRKTGTRNDIQNMGQQEKNLFITGLNWMMNTFSDQRDRSSSNYDIFVKEHRRVMHNDAYSPRLGLSWHNDFLDSFEKALQRYDDRILLPYMDLCNLILKRSETSMTKILEEHPLKNVTIIKECSWIGPRLKRFIYPSDFILKRIGQSLNCSGNAATKKGHFGIEEFADVHSLFGPCVKGGSHMACPSCAVSDPIFWMIYAYIDMVK